MASSSSEEKTSSSRSIDTVLVGSLGCWRRETAIAAAAAADVVDVAVARRGPDGHVERHIG